MTYPVAAAAAELRALPGMTGIPVDIDEPLPGHQKGPGAYVEFVVVALYHGTALPATAIRETALIVRCYAATRGAAWARWLIVEPAFRNRRARMASGLGVWNSSIVPGSVLPDLDPKTQQPVVYAIVNYPTDL
jgi:hypothetical protein